MRNILADETRQPPPPNQFDTIADGHCIVRHTGESDAVFADRLLFELDVMVEEIWACQDCIRAVRDAKHAATP